MLALLIRKISIETLDRLETKSLEVEETIKKAPEELELDVENLSKDVAEAKTSAVILRRDADKLRTLVEAYIRERRRRNEEIKQYQSLILDIEQWLLETQGRLGAEVKMSSIKAVRETLKGNEVRLENKSRRRNPCCILLFLSRATGTGEGTPPQREGHRRPAEEVLQIRDVRRRQGPCDAAEVAARVSPRERD